MAGASGQASRASDSIPEVPGYRIERQIGRGSMGTVYLAEDVQLRRKVALKVLNPALADDELFRRRFDRESQSAANLDHPNIVPVYAAGQAAGMLYIAMRYMAGGDLRGLLGASGPLSLERAAAIMGAVGDALDVAHGQDLIHRDIKPANILVNDWNGRQHYYLSDFGIAKMVSTGRSLTSAGQIVGTIDYIAPEQIQGKPVDGRADLYALGCVLHQCLTNQVPFPREETAALMWAHVNDGPPPVTAARPDLPAGIDQIVAKAMAKDPRDRYSTGRQLAADLRALVADPDAPLAIATAVPMTSTEPAATSEPAPASPESVDAGMTSTYTPPPALRAKAPAPAPAPAVPAQRKRLLLTAGSVAALALIAGLATAGIDYLSSRYPNDAEQALLRQVPLALQKSCERNRDIQEGSANVQASLVCTPSGGDVNTFVFTKFSSPTALDNNYRAAVSTAGVSGNSGDCSSADRAEDAYQSDSAASRGRVLCYKKRGSSFLAWTDDDSQTLGVATRHDPDHEKLRDWWAGVADVKLPATNPPPAPQAGPPPAPTVVVPAAPAPAVDPGVFGPEMDLRGFRSGSGGSDESSDGGKSSGDGKSSDGGKSSGDGGSAGSKDNQARERKPEPDPSTPPSVPPAAGVALPAPPEGAKQEGAQPEAGQPEAAKQEAAKQEAAKQEAAKQEAAKQEAAKQEAAKQEAAKQEAAKQEAARQESAKQLQEFARRLDAAKQEAARQEAARQEAAKKCENLEKDKDGKPKDKALAEECAKKQEKK